ncbi:MAG TPA: hypothetical protein VM099_09515 [Gemmatimonadaceae bacterium]|nr:hypothetical protein [Gemmatimonadaceae bacterium]
MGKNKSNDGRQQGAIHHEPGQQGEKTRARQAEIANTGSREAGGPTFDPDKIRAHDDVGRDRLFEDRQQHDEAEKNSEKTRLAKDRDRHGHDSNDELTQRSRSSSAKRKN